MNKSQKEALTLPNSDPPYPPAFEGRDPEYKSSLSSAPVEFSQTILDGTSPPPQEINRGRGSTRTPG